MKPYIKIISAVLTSIMFATAFTSVNATEGTDKISFYLQGDINQDERINIKDVTALQKHIANISSNEIVSLETADFNCDGDVNVNDVTEIQKYALWSKYKGAPDRNYIYCDRSINYPISTDTKIKSDLILEEVNLGTMYMAEKEDWFFMALVTSKEEFLSLTKTYSPDFDDEFFKENALIYMYNLGFAWNYGYEIPFVGVEDNTLIVAPREYYRGGPANGQENGNGFEMIPPQWYIFTKVSKADIKGVDKIVCTYNTTGIDS